MHNRSQFSIEFLTTYGFAILIVFGAIGVLSSLLFDSASVLPDDCRFDEDFLCEDFAFFSDSLVIASRSLVTSSLLVTDFDCVVDGVSTRIDDASSLNSESVFIPSGGSFNFICDFEGVTSPGSNVRVDLVLRYVTESGFGVKNIAGVLTTNYNPSSESLPVDLVSELSKGCFVESDRIAILRDGQQRYFYSDPFADVCDPELRTCVDGELDPPTGNIYGYCYGDKR